MLFCFYNLDLPDTQIRETLLVEHRTYLGRFSDRIAFAGPLMRDDGKTPAGSLLVIDFDDAADAEAFLKDEPYHRAGLYQSVAIRPFVNRWPQKAGFSTP